MNIMLYIATFAILGIIALMLQRVVEGPTVFDRMNAIGVISADSLLLVVIFGYLDKRADMYVDIAIAYAVLGFVGSLILAKFIGGNKL
ncbi:MAG: pH regulation protein F [Firmicutes bacterium]|nr:pH regulation protein F [Clostridiales bacterium]MBQ3123252.1 pH regulation protein F [Bacillota bacterium]MBQ9972502.1 pH regulation protein F [Bacillota bacterium]